MGAMTEAELPGSIAADIEGVGLVPFVSSRLADA
jgi:hypothetical protein